MSDSFAGLPMLLTEIAEVAGLPAAVAIAERWGGGRLSIPKAAGDDHPLVEVVGREAADKLCAHFRVGYEGTGAYLEVPLGPAGFYRSLSERVARAKKSGLSDDQIARELGISRRTVLRHKAKRRDEDQPRLL